MKKVFASLLAFVLVNIAITNLLFAQKLDFKWKTDTLLRTSESVLIDASQNILYVSCIDGKPDAKDGNGYIAKVSTTGKIEQLNWVTGLDAPKGLGMYKNNLYVADISRVVIIDIPTGKITDKIEIEGAKFLNDVTIDEKGNVYISDSATGKIHTLKNKRPELYFQSTEFKGVNGLLAIASGLYVVDFGTGFNYTLSQDKQLTKVTTTSEGADGIVPLGNNEYLISSWHGQVHYVDAKGQSQKILDTKEQKINAADIAYDSKTKTLYIPTFLANGITAYEFKK